MLAVGSQGAGEGSVHSFIHSLLPSWSTGLPHPVPLVGQRRAGEHGGPRLGEGQDDRGSQPPPMAGIVAAVETRGAGGRVPAGAPQRLA